MKKPISLAIAIMLLACVSVSMFGIAPVKAAGTIYIRADGSINPPTAPISTPDNVTYTLIGNITLDAGANGLVILRDNVVIDGNGFTLQGSGTGNGIDLSGRENVTVRNLQIKSFDFGILLYYSLNYNNINGNTITDNNVDGIGLSSSSNNSISGNNITNNRDYGIWLGSSSNNSISGNNITNNSYYGIWLDSSSNNSVSGNNMANNTFYEIGLYFSSNYNSIIGNNITNGDWGIYLISSNYNSISGNTITNNQYGIYLRYSSDYNSIVGNNITNNSYYGIELDFSSSNSKFYHNNFINNVVQVFGEDSANVWDDGYPSGGNYWSDYTGADLHCGPYQNETGSDGSGDTLYVIDANNRDNYPLMKPYPWDSHDIGITYIGKVWEIYFPPIILPLKTTVGIGFKLRINVFVMNYGAYSEVFNVTVYANTTVIESVTDVTLTNRSSIILNFTWDTTSVVVGNYVVSVYVSPVTFEEDLTDNNCSDGQVLITIGGDVTGPVGLPDGKVDMRDIGALCSNFGRTPAHPLWNPNFDVNDDGVINMRDSGIACNNFGKHYP